MAGLEVVAICDSNRDALNQSADVARFENGRELIASGTVDAVLIATPHDSPTPIRIEALEAGLHVLVEKPISVHEADCERLIAAHQSRKQIFAAMKFPRISGQAVRRPLRKELQYAENTSNL